MAKPELHLIPDGFEGPVIIIYEDPNGAPLRMEGDTIRYDIPVSGVYRTQSKLNEGWGRPDYEYVDAAGRRTPIVPGTPCVDSLAGDPVQACLDAIKSVGDNTPRYNTYVVSHRRNREQMYARGAKMVDSLFFSGRPYR
jgi:hypothetical protein